MFQNYRAHVFERSTTLTYNPRLAKIKVDSYAKNQG